MDFSVLPWLLVLLTASLWGSWHCALMCGPLCVALSQKSSLWNYHLGRVLSYSAAGALAGVTGQYFVWHTHPMVRILSFVFLIVGFVWLTVLQLKNSPPKMAQRLWLFLRRHTPNSHLGLGMLSIFLPCSWLFYFLLAAAGTQSALHGAGVMFCLWLGGLPALAGSSLLSQRILRQAPQAKRKIATGLLTVAGLYALIVHYIHHF